MATISGQGVDGETTQRILDFLNRAQTAADIAGKEPQAGPVHDDPRTGYGDQIADYDIGETVARRIIDRRLTYGFAGFTDLALECNVQAYDFCAVVPIVEGAGGVITDWQGRALDMTGGESVLASATPALHERARAILLG